MLSPNTGWRPMLERAVTLPMADILAEAPEVSPWWGMDVDVDAAFSEATIRTLDGMDAAGRMLAVMQIRGLTPNGCRTLMAVASYGWVGWYRSKWIERTANISQSALSIAMRDLTGRGIIRRHPRFAADGGRLFLITVSGRHIPTDGPGTALLESQSAQQSAGTQPGTARSLRVRQPDGTQPGTTRSHRVQQPESDYRALLESQSADALLNFESPDVGLSVDDLYIQSPGNINNHQETGSLEIINKLTDRAALLKSESVALSQPEWWPILVDQVKALPNAPRCPSWRELLYIAHPGDGGLRLLAEACGRLLDQYSVPGAPRVRRARGVIASIYRSLCGQAQQHAGGWEAFADASCWASEYYLAPVSAMDRHHPPAPDRVGPPSAAGHSQEDWPTWYQRLVGRFPDIGQLEYLTQKAEEFGLDNPMRLRAAELTIEGCRNPQGALKYWLRACATAKTQAASAVHDSPLEKHREEYRKKKYS